MSRYAILIFGVGVIVFFVSSSLLLDYLHAAGQAEPTISENFDIRDASQKEGAVEYERRIEKFSDEQIEDNLELRKSMAEARGEVSVMSAAANLDVSYSQLTHSPEVVDVNGGGSALRVSVASQTRSNMVKGFLSAHSGIFGLTTEQIESLNERTSYTNPDGKISWVSLEQRWNGLPVFRGELTAAFSANGNLMRTVGGIVPGPEAETLLTTPKVSAAAAVVAAAAAVNLTVNEGNLTVKETAPDGTSITFNPVGPFNDDIKVELKYFPLDAGLATLAWSMVLWQDSPSYYTLVDAEEGEVLWRKNITNDQSEAATYVVYGGRSPAPLSPMPGVPGGGMQGPIVARTPFTLISEGAFNNLGWLTDGVNTTTGNNVDAGMDVVSPNGIDPAGRPVPSVYRVFDYAYNPGPGDPAPGDAPTLADYRMGEAVNMFFWTNRYHDLTYQLGFTEAARNFQQDNFGRGGLGNDRVLAEGQDFSGTNNANFATPPDGSSGRMQMYIFTGPTPDRSSGLDQEVVIHELTHGLSNRLHNNASGLTATISRGMGEGWSDFYALMLLSQPGEDPHGVYAMGGYSTLGITTGFVDNYYYGIRRFPHATKSTVGANGKPHNPLTFADIDPAQINLTDGAYPRGPVGSSTAFAVHNIGEIWCSALWEVRARFVDKYGWAVGNQLALQLVTDGMKLDPVNPTLLDGRNSILAADRAANGGANEIDIWTGFATRGMGFSASVVSATTGSVIEAFDLPNLNLGAVSFTDDASCSTPDGYADPGETLAVDIPLANPYAVTTASNVTVAINGGSPVAYDNIAGGGTSSKSIPYTVPTNAECGKLIDLNITISSSIGTVTKIYKLQVGKPVVTLTNTSFASNLPVAIPDLTTVDIPINVTDTGFVSDVNVKLRLNHTADIDLVVSLIAPDGTSVILANRRGSSGDNFGSGNNDCSGTPTIFDDSAATAIGSGSAPFAATYRPDFPLSAFNGKSTAGVWILRVADVDINDAGTVGCAALEINRQRFTCCGVPGTPEIWAAPPATIAYESASPANNAPDPDETVTVNFPVWNVGTGNTTNLTATLLEGGGVLAPSGIQSYGALTPGAAAITKPFTFTVTGECGGNVTATLALMDGTVNLGTVSFTMRIGTTADTTTSYLNATPIIIPATGTGSTTGAPATPYPSTVEVSGITETVTKVTVDIFDYNHTFPSEVDVLLVGPQGQKLLLMSDVGGGTDTVNVNLTFDDIGSALSTTAIVNGTYRPSNITAGDVFPAPAPTGPYPDPQRLSIFNSVNPNGTWSLYVVDDSTTDIGNFNGGWRLNITTTRPVCNVSACALTTPPNITVGNDLFQPGAVVNYPAPVYSGSCGVVKSAPASGSFFPLGTTPVAITGTRQDGATTATSFDVTVKGPTKGLITGEGAVKRSGEYANFSFNAKYHWGGRLEGELTYGERCGANDYRLRSVKLTFLQVKGHEAVFIGKAKVNGVDGYTFRVFVEDHCEPGRRDRFGMSVTAPDGSTVPDLTFDPVRLVGGNIQLHY